MKRREFFTFVGGAAAAWPLAGRAQQAGVPLVGFLQRSAPIRSDFAHFWDGLAALGYEAGLAFRTCCRFLPEPARARVTL
jgi:hypothetical protein